MFTAAPAAAPAAPAAVPASAPATSDGGVEHGSLSMSFGLLDSDLDDIKDQAASAFAGEGTRAKKPKVTHSLFFDEDKGFKKIFKTFPKIKFQGKGKEVEDLKLLLKFYEKWFKELHPHGDHFEDQVWKARNVLNEKEKDGDGISSDPKERLHMLRFQYKNSVDSLAGIDEDFSQATGPGGVVSDEARKRIEANKKKAMELREKKRREQGGSSGAAAAPEEDMDALWAEAEAMGQAPQSSFDDEDDPFGFGFDMGAGSGGGTQTGGGSKQPATMDYEDEDPFGFGGGGGGGAFDDDDDDDAEPPRPAEPPTAVEIAPAPPAPAVDPEVARRIAENREKAMARKRKREEKTAAVAESAPVGSEEARTEAQASSTDAPAVVAASSEGVADMTSDLQPNKLEEDTVPELPFSLDAS